MKVSELSGPLLGLWVARALGYELVDDHTQIGLAAADRRSPVIFYSDAGVLSVAGNGLMGKWGPSTNWAQGGPLLDELIATGHWQVEPWDSQTIATGSVLVTNFHFTSEDFEPVVLPLGDHNMPRMDFVASDVLTGVCRAKVAIAYGDEVPNEAAG